MLSDNKQKTDGNKMARTQRRRVLGGNWVLGGCLWGVEEMGGNGRCLCVGFPDGGTCPSSHSCCSATRDHLQNHLKQLFSWYILEQFDIVILSTTGHRDIKHCFLVLSRDFSQYGSCAGSFYQEQKVANIGEFKIVSSEIP